MGNRGRYGKYGESKRFDRLRCAKDSLRASAGARPPGGGGGLRTGPHRRQGSRTQVRPSQEADLPFISRLSATAFARYGPYGEIIPQWFASPKTLTLIALSGTRPVGFAMLGPLPLREEPQPVAELLAIAVDGKNHRSGFGRRLLKKIEERAVMKHLEKIFLHTSTDNLSAQRLFRGGGYRPCAVKQGFYPWGQDAVMMVKDMGRAPEAEASPPGG